MLGYKIGQSVTDTNSLKIGKTNKPMLSLHFFAFRVWEMQNGDKCDRAIIPKRTEAPRGFVYIRV